MVLEQFLNVVLLAVVGAEVPGADWSGVPSDEPASSLGWQPTKVLGRLKDRFTGKTSESERRGAAAPSPSAASFEVRPFRSDHVELAGSDPIRPTVAESEPAEPATSQHLTPPTRPPRPRRRRVPEHTVADYVKEAWAARQARPARFERLGSLWADPDEGEDAEFAEPENGSGGAPSLDSSAGESVWDSPRPETRRTLPMGLWPKSPSTSSPPQADESASRKMSPLKLLAPPSDRRAGSVAPSDSQPAVPANSNATRANSRDVNVAKHVNILPSKSIQKAIGHPAASDSAPHKDQGLAATSVPDRSGPASRASDPHRPSSDASPEPEPTGPELFPPPGVAAMGSAPPDQLENHVLPEPAANAAVAMPAVADAPHIHEPTLKLDTAAPAAVEVVAAELSDTTSSSEFTPAGFVEFASPDSGAIVHAPEEAGVVLESDDKSAAGPAESEVTAELPAGESDDEPATAEQPATENTESAAGRLDFGPLQRLKDLPFEYYAGGLLVLTAVAFLALPGRRRAESDRIAVSSPAHAGRGMLAPFVTAVGLAIVAVGAAAAVRARMTQQATLFRPGMLIAAAGQVVLLIGIITLAARHARLMRLRRMSGALAVQSELAGLGYAVVPAGSVSAATAAANSPRNNRPVHTGQIAQLKAQLACLSQQLDHLVSGA